jgi:hypothetical protein
MDVLQETINRILTSCKKEKKIDDKLYGYTADDWMFATLDMLDGNSSLYDIRQKGEKA